MDRKVARVLSILIRSTLKTRTTMMSTMILVKVLLIGSLRVIMVRLYKI